MPSLPLGEILPAGVVMLLMCMRDGIEYHLTWLMSSEDEGAAGLAGIGGPEFLKALGQFNVSPYQIVPDDLAEKVGDVRPPFF